MLNDEKDCGSVVFSWIGRIKAQYHLQYFVLTFLRAISWTQGRTSNVILSDPYLHSELPHDDDYFTKVLEIYEISNHFMLSQVSSCSTFEARLGLPTLYKKEDYYVNVMRFESCLDRWQKALPRSLAPAFVAINEDTPSVRQRTVLHLR